MASAAFFLPIPVFPRLRFLTDKSLLFRRDQASAKGLRGGFASVLRDLGTFKVICLKKCLTIGSLVWLNLNRVGMRVSAFNRAFTIYKQVAGVMGEG